MPLRKDRYEADPDPKNCGHPNQKPFTLNDSSSPTGKTTHTKCGDDKKPGCGEEWPK